MADDYTLASRNSRIEMKIKTERRDKVEAYLESKLRKVLDAEQYARKLRAEYETLSMIPVEDFELDCNGGNLDIGSSSANWTNVFLPDTAPVGTSVTIKT